MAQIANPHPPAYMPIELNFDLFQGSFANEPHDFYYVYDEVMDQLYVRLVDPTVFASEYAVSDEIAFLVRDDTREVVRYTILDFQASFLPNAPKLHEVWIANKLAEKWRTYSKARYEPTQYQQQKPRIPVQQIARYSAYRSKAVAAGELVLA